MRLLLDEMLTPGIAELLRKRGHDAVAIGESTEWRGSSDDEVLAIAREEGRVLVTNNVTDFIELHNRAVAPGGDGHPGLILLSSRRQRTRSATGKLADDLAELIELNPGEDDLANSLSWL